MSRLSSHPRPTEAGLHRTDSSLTLTNDSPSFTPWSSMDSSTDRQKREPMEKMEKISRTAEISRNYLLQELDSSYMSVVLVTLFFISGLVDSVAFNSWNCFVNMQSGKSYTHLTCLSPAPLTFFSGNTVFAALGLSGQPQASHNQQYYKSLTAIGAFCLGSLFFSALHRCPTGLSNPPSSLRRLHLILSFFIQTCFVVISASLVSTHTVSNKPFSPGSFSSGSQKVSPSMVNFLDLCPIAFLSFQAAGQVTLSRLLGIIELPTIVLSTLYHDTSADLYTLRDSWRKSSSMWEFFVVHEKRQERRAACIVALFLGAIIGGFMYKSAVGMGGALWLAAGLKLAVVVGWFFWREAKDSADANDEIPV